MSDSLDTKTKGLSTYENPFELQTSDKKRFSLCIWNYNGQYSILKDWAANRGYPNQRDMFLLCCKTNKPSPV
ncbi:uncharacterized protein [Musca autumnalis]|uniref:uncharacterized protein n=1 Tax=Musca autumnalis TaxID=221902 RepID=UPI003CF66156